MTRSIAVAEATSEEELRRVEALLRAADLPASDLDSSPVRLFVAYEDDEFVGTGGMEAYGPDALLRSVAVPDSVRGRGYGTAVYRDLESRAREDGIERLFLLTTTAAGFFDGLGFEPIDRDDAPAPIRETTEFRELCSVEATCMRKVVA